MVTGTLETARPWGSLTVPRISPVFIWACAAVAPMSNKTPVARQPAKRLIFVVILSCPFVETPQRARFKANLTREDLILKTNRCQYMQLAKLSQSTEKYIVILPKR